MRALLILQLLVVALAASITGLMFSLKDAGAVLYGGTLAISMTLLMRRSTNRALKVAVETPGRSMAIMYSGLVLRYAMALLGLLAGFKVLQLPAQGMIIGFVLTIMIQVFAIRLVKS